MPSPLRLCSRSEHGSTSHCSSHKADQPIFNRSPTRNQIFRRPSLSGIDGRNFNTTLPLRDTDVCGPKVHSACLSWRQRRVMFDEPFTHGDFSSLLLLGLQLLTCPTFRKIHRNERDRLTFAERLAAILESRMVLGAQGQQAVLAFAFSFNARLWPLLSLMQYSARLPAIWAAAPGQRDRCDTATCRCD